MTYTLRAVRVLVVQESRWDVPCVILTWMHCHSSIDARIADCAIFSYKMYYSTTNVETFNKLSIACLYLPHYLNKHLTPFFFCMNLDRSNKNFQLSLLSTGFFQ